MAVTLITAPASGTVQPERLFGLIRLRLDQEQRRLVIHMGTPGLCRPGEPLRVNLAVTRAGEPTKADIHLLAVDEGVLSLTSHPVPNPFSFFYSSRRCPVNFADMYDEIIDEPTEAHGMVSRIGGGAAAARLDVFLSGHREEDVRHAIVLSKVIETDDSGHASASFPTPEFNGRLRVVAVALNREAVGSAVRPVFVRRPLTMLLSGPRTVAPDDTFEVTAVVSTEQPLRRPGHIRLILNGPARILSPDPSRLLEAGAAGYPPVVWRCRAAGDAMGRVDIRVEAQTEGETTSAKEFLRVRTASPPVFRARFLTIQPGETKVLTYPTGYVRGSLKASVEVASSRHVEVLPALAWLQDYAYTCLEQTVSRGVAALAFPALAKQWDPEAPSSALDSGPLRQTLRRLAVLELPRGGFSMWSGGRDVWTSASVYACHFLSEVARTGYPLDPALKRRCMAFCTRVLREGADDVGIGDRAYALYILGTFGSPERDVARAMAGDAAGPSLVRLLAAATLIGADRASEGMPLLEQALKGDLRSGVLAWDFDSDVRRQALALCVLADVSPQHPAIPRLVDALRRARNEEGHWGTTQDNALVLLALSKLPPVTGGARARVRLPNGEIRTSAPDEPLALSLTHPDDTIRVTAVDGPLSVCIRERGVPTHPRSGEFGHGLTVRREYLRPDGEPVDILRHGDLVRVRITLATPGWRRNVVIADLLPGGLEVENAQLRTRHAIHEDPHGLDPSLVQPQDDRLVLCADIYADDDSGPATFEYTARAVTRGTFHIPRIRAESMYDATVAAESGGQGMLTIE